MRKLFLICFIILSCLACETPVDHQATSGYFDLDELLTGQVQRLGNGILKSDKLIQINEESDRIYQELNSKMLEEELDIFKPFNPGLSRYRNAFEVTEIDGITTYTKKDDVKQSLQWVKVERQASMLTVSAEILEETSIYTTQKKMSLVLDSDQIRSFSLLGYQKMLFKDTAFFDMRVTIE